MPHFNKLILFICVFVAPSLWAGTFEEAEKAYWNGQYTLAASIWEPMAKAGDADAQNGMGLIYAFGNEEIHKEFMTARYWYTLSARQGNVEAYYNLGVLYMNQKLTENHHGFALESFQKAAEMGHIASHANLGSLYLTGGDGVHKDMRLAVKHTRIAADAGNAVAANNLGEMYVRGIGVLQNYETAAKYFRIAADNGSGEAMDNLAALYVDGTGVPVNYPEALKLLQSAVDKGVPSAAFKMGMMYFQGLGVPKSEGESLKWFSKSADGGDPDGQNAMCDAYGLGRGVKQDFAQATYWCALAAQQGHKTAEDNVMRAASQLPAYRTNTDMVALKKDKNDRYPINLYRTSTIVHILSDEGDGWAWVFNPKDLMIGYMETAYLSL
ncbi:tetratricopeptide repeat protein [Zhongshania sp.]|uniref:tetratricopeptide repeat protein n=1 Tax=Zhongshania sp. TaxID=1971902 RepID=UPI00356ABDA9